MEPYLLGLYEKSMPDTLSLTEKLITAKDSGFDYLEISIDESDSKLSRLDWGDNTIRDAVEAQQHVGIPIKSMCFSGHRRFPMGHTNLETLDKSLDIMQKAIVLSSRLGIRIIQLAGYDVYYEKSSDATRRIFAQSLALAAEMAAREGIMLAFETMETPFMNTVEKAMKWVSEIRSPYLQIYPDIGNMTNACMDSSTQAAKDLLSGAGHIAAVHLKETKPNIFREVPYGSGHVDFVLLAKTAWQLGARMFVGEFWYTGEANWQNIIKDNNRFLRTAIKKAQEII